MKEAVNNHPHHSTEKAVKREKKIKQKNGPQKKLGFRDTSTKSSRLCQYLYSSVRRGRQRRKEDREATVRREKGWRELNVNS